MMCTTKLFHRKGILINMLMLDTNTCIYALNKNNNVLNALKKNMNNDLCISSIVLAELNFGVFNSARFEENKNKLNAFLNLLEIIPFDSKCAAEYGKLRSYLKQKGKIIGNNDLLIASHALSVQATLITNNLSEFIQVPNLQVENWI